MKKFRTKNIILRAGAALLSIGILFSSILWIAPVEVSAAEVTEEVTKSSFNAPEYLPGKVFMGTEGLKDPVEKTYDENGINGTYYEPQTYIYFGSYYDSNLMKDVSLVHRVLDADADNTGAGGAMFVLSEFADYNTRFSRNPVGTNDYTTGDNVFPRNRLANEYYVNLFATNKYRTSEYKEHFKNIPEDLDYVRKVTKSDSNTDVKGLFGFVEGMATYDWVVYSADEYALDSFEDGDEVEYLKNSRFFPLSVREFNDYVSKVSGAPGVAVKKMGSDTYVDYWLRTGAEPFTGEKNGNMVGAVTAEGTVTAMDVDGKVGWDEAVDADVYVRYGFNIETADIAFTQILADKTHRLAFIEPLYKNNTSNPFEAEIINTEGDVVTVEYRNAIRDGLVSYGGVTDKNYISVIIKDSAGNVKHYGSVAEVRRENGCTPASISGTDDIFKFRLPEEYVEGDEIYVFWERKSSAEGAISHVSNMVSLGCVHTVVSKANCVSAAKCSKCGEIFGFIDTENHEGVDPNKYYYDDSYGIHWNVCDDCGTKVNTVNCTFGASCITPCVCGNYGTDESLHSFDDRGLCMESYPAVHYQPAEVSLNDSLGTGTVYIENVGQLIGFSRSYNRGGFTDRFGNPYELFLIIRENLDFEGLSGFEPIGTEQMPFRGGVNGGSKIISNLSVETDGKYAGIFGYAPELRIYNWTVEKCSFVGAENVGIFAGSTAGEGSSTYNNIDIYNCTVDSTGADGKEGILTAVAEAEDSVYDVYTHSINNAEGEYVRIATDPEGMKVSHSAFFWTEKSEYGEYTAEQYASGMVAHELGMRQKLGEDLLPSRNTQKPRVGRISDCSGALIGYTNERLSVHLPMDRTQHVPTKFNKFVWDGASCAADVYCSACQQNVMLQLEVEEDFRYAPARGDYTARIEVGGEEYTETVTIFGERIESKIGITPIEKVFDGVDIYPEDFMDNHKLDPGTSDANSEYIVFFVDPGDPDDPNDDVILKEEVQDSQGGMWVTRTYPTSAVAAGTYDLLVIGGGKYTGQEYTFKSVLVINPITITVNTEDVYKYYDGDATFVPSYTVDVPDAEYMINVSYSDGEKAEIGEYELDVNIELEDLLKEYESSVSIVVTNDKVKGTILPQFQVSLENKSYPTKVVYGDGLPEPDEKYFDFTEGAKLTYEWFVADFTRFEYADTGVEYVEIKRMNRIDEKPENVGRYVLRVRASHTSNMIGSYVDIAVEITPKILTVKLLPPEGGEFVKDEYDRQWCILSPGEEVIPVIEGLPEGVTPEEAGVSVSIYQQDGVYAGRNLPEINDAYSFPIQPNVYDYNVMYNIESVNPNYDGTSSYESIYVRIESPDAPIPVIDDEYEYVADGNEKKVGVVFAWDALSVEDLSGILYSINVIYDGDSLASYDVRHIDLEDNEPFVQIPVSKAGDYSVTVTTMEYGEAIGEPVRIDFSVSFDKDGELLDSIVDMGDYTVTVISSDGSVTRSIDLTVKREISMRLKESDYFISEGEMKFDPKNVVMEAGKVLLIGHTLADVDIYVNASEHGGYSGVDGITVHDANGNDVSHLYRIAYSPSVDHENGGLGVVHIYDSPCDTDCNVYGCTKTRQAGHVGGVATCISPAICESCGAEYGSLEIHRHVSDDTHIAPNPDELMTHREVYSCCGLTKEIMGHTPKTPATCTERAVCTDCGWAYGSVDPDNHSSEECTYAVDSNDPAKHLKIRKCCGMTVSEEHFGGSANCASPARCEGCLAAYGEKDLGNHGDNVDYTVSTADATKHSAHCSACGEIWTEDHSGGTATCATLASCEKCGEGHGELDADAHESEETYYAVRKENPSMHDLLHKCCDAFISKAYHSGGEANCATAAICESCGAEHGKKDPSNHASEEFKYAQSSIDATAHVKYHKCCGVEVAVEAHTGENTATCEHGNVCNICSREYGDKLEHVYDNDCDAECNECGKVTRSYGFHIDADGDLKCDVCAEDLTVSEDETEGPGDDTQEPDGRISDVAVSGIGTASAVVVGTGGFSAVWFGIKKKSWAELLGLLIG